MIPWNCDALLDAAPRYASDKFRRVARMRRVDDLDYADAAELVAFLGLVPIRYARWVFHWPEWLKPIVAQLETHMLQFDEVHAMRVGNDTVVGQADGLAIFTAMKDGGWGAGKVPPCVTMALQGLRDQGLSYPEIGAAVGVTREQAKTLTGYRRPAAAVPLVLWAE